jgi:tRNA (mo5U34)-methyltransferase
MLNSVSERASKLALRRETDRSPALRKLGWYHSFEFPDGTSIQGVQSITQLRERWASYPLPSDLTGRRVLDIGAWDGWFSFEAERRGASVVAVDCVEIANLVTAKRRLGSRIDYRVTNLYKLPNLQLGAFDYVFFLGVLYHVKHPLLALQIVCALTLDVAIVESAVIDGPAYQAGVREEIPTLEFFEIDELGGHFDNWFGPSVSCLMAMCRAAGFARVELLYVIATTACVACYRHWPERRASFTRTRSAPELIAVANNADLGINVSRDNDDYLTWWFHSEDELTFSDLEFEAGDFGCHAVALIRREGNVWSANTMLPPGIAQGWVPARMRTIDSPWTESKRIAVDMPVCPIGELRLDALQDGTTWERNILSSGATHVILWVRGLGENADRSNIVVLCEGERLIVDFVGDPDMNNGRQVNARLGNELLSGSCKISVQYGSAVSNSIDARC